MTSCPYNDCGCNAVVLEEVGTQARRPWARYRCDACRRSFYDGQRPAALRGAIVVIKAPRCPNCHSTDTAVNRSKRMPLAGKWQKQYRACNQCGSTFVAHKERTGDADG